MDDTEIDFTVPINDARDWTGKGIVPNVQCTYITQEVIVGLGLHSKVEAEITLVDAEFWCSDKTLKMGPVGHAGCMASPKCPCQQCNPKPLTRVSEDRYMLVVQCIVLENPYELITRFNPKFVTTKGPRNNFIIPIKCKKVHRKKTIKTAIMPKPETIEAFRIVLAKNPKMTMEDFVVNHPSGYRCSKYNKYLVDLIDFSLGGEPVGALEIYTEEAADIDQPAYEISFKMMASDLKLNMDLIKEFLTELSKFNFNVA